MALSDLPKILLYGMGGHALVLMDACKELGIEIAGFFDDQAVTLQREGKDLPNALGPYRPDCWPELPLLMAIGNNQVREQIGLRVTHAVFTLIHPTALVSPTAKIEAGAVLLHGSIVQSNAHIGRLVIVNAGAVIDHEAVLGDYCHVRSLAYIGGGARVAAKATVPPLHVVERNTTFGA